MLLLGAPVSQIAKVPALLVVAVELFVKAAVLSVVETVCLRVLSL